MESKTVKIVIIVAVIIGIIAIIGITALVIQTTKSSEPRILDLNDENQIEGLANEEQEQESENEGNNEEESSIVDNSDNATESIENTEIEAFNQVFLPYEGEDVSGKNVNALLEKIRISNEQNEEHPVRALANVQNWDSENKRANTESKYKVTMEKDEESGYINIIKIEDAE